MSGDTPPTFSKEKEERKRKEGSSRQLDEALGIHKSMNTKALQKANNELCKEIEYTHRQMEHLRNQITTLNAEVEELNTRLMSYRHHRDRLVSTRDSIRRIVDEYEDGRT